MDRAPKPSTSSFRDKSSENSRSSYQSVSQGARRRPGGEGHHSMGAYRRIAFASRARFFHVVGTRRLSAGTAARKLSARTVWGNPSPVKRRGLARKRDALSGIFEGCARSVRRDAERRAAGFDGWDSIHNARRAPRRRGRNPLLRREFRPPQARTMVRPLRETAWPIRDRCRRSRKCALVFEDLEAATNLPARFHQISSDTRERRLRRGNGG